MSKNTNLNLDDIPLTDVDYEGVIYEPSSDSAGFDIDTKIPKKNNSSKSKKSSSNTADSSRPKKKVAQNFNFGFFMALMFAISLGLLTVTASVLKPYLSSYFPSSKSSTSVANPNTNQSNNIPELTELAQPVPQSEFTGVIKEIEYISGRFVIFDFKSNKSYSLISNATTVFKDRFNSPLTIQEIKVGDIVDFNFNENNNLVSYIHLNSSAFSMQNVKPEKINISDSSIKLTGNTYSVSSSADIFKDEELIEFLDLSLVDKISVNGYDNVIYSIKVNNSTGTLVFVNKPSLNNAIVEIDRDYFRPLDSVDQIELEEGQHKLVIKATNVDSYLKDFEIIAGEETVLDLSDVQNKFGSILIKADVSDYKLYINNEETENRGYHSLRYGTYFVKVEKEGYETYETQISINKQTDTLEIELEKIEEPEEFGLLSITSTPDGAEVYVDNISIGKTPLVKYNLPQGTHTIKLTLSGYNDFLLTSVSISDEPAEFNVTMHPKSSSNTTEATTSGVVITENQNMVDYIQENTVQDTTIQNQSQDIQTTIENQTEYTTASITESITEYQTESVIQVTTSLIPDNLIYSSAEEESVFQSILTNYDQFNQFQSQSQITTNSSQFEYPTVMTTSANVQQTQATTSNTTVGTTQQATTQATTSNTTVGTTQEATTQATTSDEVSDTQDGTTQATTSDEVSDMQEPITQTSTANINTATSSIPEIVGTPTTTTSSHPMFEQFE